MLGSEQELEDLDKKISQRRQKSRRRALLTSLIILIATLIGVSTSVLLFDYQEEKFELKRTIELKQQVDPVKSGLETKIVELEKLAETIDNTGQTIPPSKQQDIQRQIREINRELQIYQRSLPSSEELDLE